MSWKEAEAEATAEVTAKAVAEVTAKATEMAQEARVEIMIPLVGSHKELKLLRRWCEEEIEKVQRERGEFFSYLIGTMIELPRSALTAHQIATHADFFSFGTNDLTQTTWGISRDDAGKFLEEYIEHKVFEEDPFVSIDREGVGALIQQASRLGRKAKSSLKMGVCGEHGGDPKSVAFFHELGLDYISCSPFRLPVARLAAAQGALRAEALKVAEASKTTKTTETEASKTTKVAEASKNPSTDPEKSQGTPLDSSSDKSCLKDSIEERDLSLDNNP